MNKSQMVDRTGAGKMLSICIPSYNRAALLGPLLDSIFSQTYEDFEVVICEDCSPQRERISAVVKKYIDRYPGKIVYVENPINHGYDGNIRRLIELSRGQYCVFMGNDDLMCPDALEVIIDVISCNPNCGVVVRSYATFDDDPQNLKQVFRYFPERRSLDPGAQAICAAFRRSVVIPGMVIKRDAALDIATDRFDGTLLYQLYLVGMILANHSVVFVPQVIALRRDGTPPDFGNSAVEQGKFVPHDQTPESSLHFMKGMLAIARHIEVVTGLDVFRTIRLDIGNYSYPILSIQANRSMRVFFSYGCSLAKLGFWRYPLFHLYFLSLLILGVQRSDAIVKYIKRRLGYTPRFGTASTGVR